MEETVQFEEGPAETWPSDEPGNGSLTGELKLQFLLWWIVVNTSGGVVAVFLAEAVTGGVFTVLYTNSTNSLVAGGATGLILGTCIGVFGWLVLRRYMPISGTWVCATGAGWGIGLTAAVYLHFVPDSWFAVLLGTCISFPQCFVLWKHVPRSLLWLWPVANIVAWTLVTTTLPAVFLFTSENIGPSGYSGFVNSIEEPFPYYEFDVFVRHLIQSAWVFGVLAVITGAALAWLLEAGVQTEWDEGTALAVAE